MIFFNKKNKVFYLNTEKTSYIIGLLNGELPVHIYWGKKIDRIPDDWSKTYIRRVLSAYDNGEFSSNSLPHGDWSSDVCSSDLHYGDAGSFRR